MFSTYQLICRYIANCTMAVSNNNNNELSTLLLLHCRMCHVNTQHQRATTRQVLLIPTIHTILLIQYIINTLFCYYIHWVICDHVVDAIQLCIHVQHNVRCFGWWELGCVLVQNALGHDTMTHVWHFLSSHCNNNNTL